MSAERLAVGDLIRCSRCRGWHPAETGESDSATDYAERMLFIRCGAGLFYVGQQGLPARNPTDVRCPLVEKLWRVINGSRELFCELRQDADGWDVLMRSDGEALFSRRCTDEAQARFVADGLKRDELNGGWSEVAPG